MIKKGGVKVLDYLGDIYNYSTEELVKELTTRTGVTEIKVAPYVECSISIDGKEVSNTNGSAIVLYIVD